MTGREIAEALLDELQAHGLGGTVSWDSRHPRLRWRDRHGQDQWLPFPATPSDWRAKHNSIAALRRRLKGGDQ